MDRKNKQPKGRHEHPLRGEIPASQKKQNTDAHQQAEEDMFNDAELTANNPNDDLDEGESARLGDDRDLV
jgi:hypothetical protein